MAIKHGNKSYFQVLLDPNRSELIEELASLEGIKGTAWIRNLVYRKLEMNSLHQFIKLLKPKIN